MKRKIAANLGLIVGSCVLANVAAAAPDLPTTLKDAAQQAVLNNPEVKSRWHNFNAVTENIDVVSGWRYPTVDVSAAVARERQETPTVNATYNRSNFSLRLAQMLFDGKATSHQLAEFNFAQRVRYFELLDISESTALEAARAYTDVLRFRGLHQLAQENYVQHRAVHEQIQLRVKSGVGRRVDLEQASGRLALAESNLLTEASNLHDVSARYQRIVGELPAERLADLPAMETGLPGRSDQALRVAYTKNPALAAAQENIVAKQYDAKYRNSRFYPRFDLLARHDVGRNLDGVDGTHKLTNVELVLNYNLYRGGSDKAEERQYWELVNVAKDLRDKECRDVRQTLYIAFNDVQRLKEQLNYLEQHQLSIEKARDAYRKQFDIGQRTLLDLLDTENELFEAKRALLNARHDYRYALIRTHASMGNLLSALSLQHLNTDKLVNKEERAEFDPDTICPPNSPFQMAVDKDKVFADAMASMPPMVLPVVGGEAGAIPAAMAGMPLGDEDGDGVTDDKDRCPGTPRGTRVDAQGCPLKEIIDLKGVHFEYNSYALRPDSYPILMDAVKVLKRYPELRVEVAGHTDYHNTVAFNQILSDRRANAVRDYLIAQGIEAGRLTAKGYSELQPIADNTTEEGQAMNRRVELKIQNK
jgi:adhesin transport system outer membrane protein